MSVQTVHFFRPPPPSPQSVQTNIFGLQNMGFTHNIYCAITKINISGLLGFIFRGPSGYESQVTRMIIKELMEFVNTYMIIIFC